MTARAGHGLDMGEPPTLEVRWIRPGQIDAGTRKRFGRLPFVSESRLDDYLIHPDLNELSVKIRAGRALEVKVYRGLLDVLDMPGCARGLMELWQKWSFPLGATRHADESSSWQPVHKVRRIAYFSVEDGQLTGCVEPPSGLGCAVELTEVTMFGRNWWTLGFEANGPTDALRDIVESTAAHVFAQATAEGLELTLGDSGSYSSWLRDQLDVR